MNLTGVPCTYLNDLPVMRWFDCDLPLARMAAIAAVALATGGCALMTPAPVDTKAQTERLLQADRDFAAQADRIGAADAFFSYMTDDTIELGPDAPPVVGRSAIRERLKPLPPYRLRWVPNAGEVSDDGSMGWTWGKWEMVGPDKQVAPVSHGKYLDVWRLQKDGSWKVVVDIGNSESKR